MLYVIWWKIVGTQVNQLRDEMESSEVRCEALGGQVYGPSTYTLTDKGAAEYRNKRIFWAYYLILMIKV